MTDGSVHAFLDLRLNQQEPQLPADEHEARAKVSGVLPDIVNLNRAMTMDTAQQTRAEVPEGQPALSVEDSLIEKLEKWIERLVRQLTAIVEKLAKGTSFSLSVGTGVSVTINFPPMGNSA